MEDLDPPVPAPPSPVITNLENMSIDDLSDYIERLEREISRAKAVIVAKQGVRRSADALFKL